MLQFFRKYQKIFYIAISIVIFISFTFFGTYSSLASNTPKDSVVFQTIDGSSVKMSEFHRYLNFLYSDMLDQFQRGEMGSANFLNDGVIRNDIIDSGLASIIVLNNQEQFQKDLEVRFSREKYYQPYRHPHAEFINVKTIWKRLYPQLDTTYNAFTQIKDPLDKEALDLRASLYLASSMLPSRNIYQFLRYQEQQNEWITHDPTLERQDFNLFGYHTLDDWFGPNFLKVTTQVIINGAKLAQEKGYRVTKEEALSELKNNVQISVQLMQRGTTLSPTQIDSLFFKQLKRMQLTEDQAVTIWRDVLLFRRLFDDVGTAYFADPLLFEPYNAKAKEKLMADLYTLPDELQLSDFSALQKFEIYLEHSSNQKKGDLSLPDSYLSVQELEKNSPELLQKRYFVEMASVESKEVEGRVRIKEMWEWQTADENWKILQKEFPALGLKKDSKSRFQAIESLDRKTRERLDAFSRKEIATLHPEWVEELLDAKPLQKKVIRVPLVGKVPDIVGINDAKDLIAFLDQTETEDYTQDQIHFYRIHLLDKSDGIELMTFREAKETNALDKLLYRRLKAHYPIAREKNSNKFEKSEGVWKPFSDVRDFVAEDYFAKTLTAIRQKRSLTPDQCALYRFHSHLSKVRDQLKNGETVTFRKTLPRENFADRISADEQWNLIKKESVIEDSELDLDQWSEILVPKNGALSFYQLKSREVDSSQLLLQMNKAQKLIGNEAKKLILKDLLERMSNDV